MTQDTGSSIVEDLRRNLNLYRELLVLIEGESHVLRSPTEGSLFQHYSSKKALLPQLTESLEGLRRHRAWWQKAGPADRARWPEIPALLRQSQDSIMKIIVLDRENEQALLRRGMIPARELPSVNRQRPHFVADLYRRQGTSGPA
ncbi:MAG: hypothetical protein EXS31_15645 [Pedosphaera sp.]|nr:hypothetical protein [Pedosphaera sp.]